MPNWEWNPAINRYRNLDTGQFVSSTQVQEWAAIEAAASSNVTDALGQMLANDQLTLPAWQTAMRQEIKEEYIRQYIAGRGGMDAMTQADWGSIGGMLQEQYGHLDNFAADIAADKLSEGGPTSGHHGHRGRPGKVGGSAPSRGAASLGAPAPNIGMGSNAAEDYLIAGADAWAKNASSSTQNATFDYSGDGYYSLNTDLRNGRSLSPADAKLRDNIDQGMGLYEADRNLILFRVGTYNSNGRTYPTHRALKPGDIVQDNGYMSTTLDRNNQYATSGKVRWQIIAPKGTKGTPLDHRSNFEDEAEFLLPRGTQLKVLSNSQYPPGAAVPTVVIKARIIPGTGETPGG